MRQFTNVKQMENNDLRFHVSGYPVALRDIRGSAYMERDSREQYNVRRPRVTVFGCWKPT